MTTVRDPETSRTLVSVPTERQYQGVIAIYCDRRGPPDCDSPIAGLQTHGKGLLKLEPQVI